MSAQDSGAYVQAVLKDAQWAAQKVAAIASAIAGSPVTTEMERLVPGLVKIVADITPIGQYANAIATLLPLAEQFASATGAKSASVDEMIAATRDKESDML